MQEIGSSEERHLAHLKMRGPQTTQASPASLAMTLPGARKHLQTLLQQAKW